VPALDFFLTDSAMVTLMIEQPHAEQDPVTPSFLDVLPPWDFALRLYTKPCVPNAMITLQDRYGLDVSFFLFLLYLAFEERRLPDAATLGELKAFVQDWQVTVVAPLRQIRRAMKTQKRMFSHPPGCELRKEVLAVELKSEQIEILLCHQWVASRLPSVSKRDASSTSSELVEHLATAASSGKIPPNDCTDMFSVLIAAIDTMSGI
jgi:uncharacterized protein (TIGR02444 family)